MLIVVVVLTLTSVGSTYARTRVKDMPEEQWLNVAGRNNILFYNPFERSNRRCKPNNGNNEGGGESTGEDTVTILDGVNVAEKVWNWFASAGIVGVSDNPNLIAGVIGNLMTEAGGNTFNINPFVVSSSGYYGMYQAGGGRATSLQAAFSAAGLGGTWGSSPSSVSDEVLNKAIDVTLTHLVNADDGSFRTFANTRPGSETAEAYSDLFLVIVERAVGGSSPILDPVAKAKSNGGNYQASAERRNNARAAYNAFSGNTGEGSSTIIQTNTESVVDPCPEGTSSEEYGDYEPGELVSGGMTLEEAMSFMQAYRSITPRDYSDPGNNLSRWSINDVTGCASDLENCVAFVQWFICEYAGVCMGLPDGSQVVSTLLNSGRGFTDGGTTPRPYAIFSTGITSAEGHTGVILGIDEARGKIIIGEAGCGMSFDFTNAKEKDLASFMSGSYTYAYTDSIISLGGV